MPRKKLPTGEAKGEFTARLKKQGLWEVFLQRREFMVQAGSDRAAAWAAAAMEFAPSPQASTVQPAAQAAARSLPAEPPPQAAEETAPIAEGPRRRRKRKRGKTSLRQDLDWVYHALETGDKQEAPSGGAAALLEWARCCPGNKTAFYTQIWPKVLPSRTQIDNEDARDDDGQDVLALVEKLLNDGSLDEPEPPRAPPGDGQPPSPPADPPGGPPASPPAA